MDECRYIAILITENYNKTVWTKTECKKALAREQKEGRNVMLPLIIGEAEIPDFIEDKVYVDLRKEYFCGITKLVGMVHSISQFRLSRAIADAPPQCVRDVWQLLQSIGFEPYVVFGADDFAEILKYGGNLIREGYAQFAPDALLNSDKVSQHVKSLLSELALH